MRTERYFCWLRIPLPQSVLPWRWQSIRDCLQTRSTVPTRLRLQNQPLEIELWKRYLHWSLGLSYVFYYYCLHKEPTPKNPKSDALVYLFLRYFRPGWNSSDRIGKTFSIWEGFAFLFHCFKIIQNIYERIITFCQ